ncbi:MAG: acetyl-CoA carboxylase carboxyltransferase subunit alpha [Bacillota bacterium]|jgi:acetyl-CoA carboxylase carboxyl transferase subunit alpha|nr:acetyl-CoA carboxylase carboxyltransferase subunit alpha [Bacillota bacterium]NLP21298.1 acetyl-CoA carboxylase carboxyltransferase subunit alpha [Erysipelotrichaceae bacterium]
MDYKDYENLINKLLEQKSKTNDEKEKEAIDNEVKRMMMFAGENLTAWDRVYIARHKDRPKAYDYIKKLFPDFIELHGDRYFGDDNAIVTGLATFHDMPVTIIAQAKGKTTEENIIRNFGMANPEGYRKAIRIAKQAEKFNRPIITFVDTSGAYPGKGAEERGQAEAIAECLFEFSTLKTVVICVVIGEGGSGGALALSIGDKIIMLENAIYSILSPEGFASILWKDETRAKEASERMKLTSFDLKNLGIVDEIIKEPLGGAQYDFEDLIKRLDRSIYNSISELEKVRMNTLINRRYEKYRKIGAYE